MRKANGGEVRKRIFFSPLAGLCQVALLFKVNLRPLRFQWDSPRLFFPLSILCKESAACREFFFLDAVQRPSRGSTSTLPKVSLLRAQEAIGWR